MASLGNFINENILAYVLAYLIGAIPFGLVFSWIFAKADISKEGSRSIGATNVLRVLKQKSPSLAKKLAILTAICDILKGLVSILIAKFIFNISYETLWAMGILAVVGHCFSPYLRFEGGKGIATAAGVLVYFLPLELVCSLIIWFFVGKITKISSLASLIALICFIILSFVFHYNMPIIKTHAPIFILAIIIIYKHLPNIGRLLSGTEKRVI